MKSKSKSSVRPGRDDAPNGQPGAAVTRMAGVVHNHSLRALVAPSMGRLRSLSDTADQLGVSPRTVRRLIADGVLPCHRVRGRLRISEGDLGEYLMQGRR